MDRVLSYQTAMRANSADTSGFDIRQYISKRTCISLTMSIAFITLIFGFLLGKFTSDRNHIIKENLKRQQELSHKTVVAQSEVDRLIDSVIEAAQFKLTTNFKEQYLSEHGASKYHNYLEQNFTSCINGVSRDTSQDDLADFLNNLLRNYYKIYIKCSKELRNILLKND